MVVAKIKSIIKQEASKDIFRPASAVANDVLLSELTDAPCPSLPRVDSLYRTANRFREQLRPQDPKDLEFELETEHIPDNFFDKDVKVRLIGPQGIGYMHITLGACTSIAFFSLLWQTINWENFSQNKRVFCFLK